MSDWEDVIKQREEEMAEYKRLDPTPPIWTSFDKFESGFLKSFAFGLCPGSPFRRRLRRWQLAKLSEQTAHQYLPAACIGLKFQRRARPGASL